MTASLPGAPSTYSGTTIYGYDTRNELTQETRTGSGTGNYSNAFSYDSAENPTQVRGVAQPTANADNQLPVSGVTFDGNGNPSKVEGLTASFDIENRATALGSVSSTWGGNGLRASKGSTYFLYDGSLPVCELSSTGSVTATNTFGGAGLISRHTSGGSTFYTFDAQGNVAQRYTSAGSLVSSDLYDAFGKGTSTGSGDVFGYEGKFGYYTDTATGLILCGHRFYDSTAGRFINRDPIGYAGGINLYGYVGNNASNGVDPDGFSYSNGNNGRKWTAWALSLLAALSALGTKNPNYPIPDPPPLSRRKERSRRRSLGLMGTEDRTLHRVQRSPQPRCLLLVNRLRLQDYQGPPVTLTAIRCHFRLFRAIPMETDKVIKAFLTSNQSLVRP